MTDPEIGEEVHRVADAGNIGTPDRDRPVEIIADREVMAEETMEEEEEEEVEEGEGEEEEEVTIDVRGIRLPPEEDIMICRLLIKE
jgi:hypothetical protein